MIAAVALGFALLALVLVVLMGLRAARRLERLEQQMADASAVLDFLAPPERPSSPPPPPESFDTSRIPTRGIARDVERIVARGRTR
jgi:hypothetical protein